MGNPLSEVSQTFWEALHWVDSVMIRVGAESFGYRPLAPQFEYLQQVDTDEIRRVAKDVWQAEQGLVHERFDEAGALVAQANRTLESWQGEAKNAYREAIAGTEKALEQVNDPASSLSEQLHALADSYDTSILEIIEETITATSDMWGEVSDDAPEDKADAIVQAVVLLVAILVSIVVFYQNVFESMKTNMGNVKNTIADCQAVIDSAKA